MDGLNVHIVCFTSSPSRKVEVRAEARHARQNKALLPAVAKPAERGEPCASSRYRSNFERAKPLDSSGVASSLKNRQSRSDVLLECDPAFYWRRTSAALTALHGTTVIFCRL